MARARGANALLNGKFETTSGVPPSGNYMQLPFVSAQLGATQGLLEDDLLGLGREGGDPELDVVVNDGDVVVPVDVRAFGNWLKALFGAPTTAAADAAAGYYDFSDQPAVDSSITVNGTAFTFKASGATGNQVNIGVDVAATAAATVAKLNASVVSGVAESTYAVDVDDDTILTVTHDTTGLAGNAFTLVAGAGSNATPSGATLTGGTNSHTFNSGLTTLPSLSLEVGHPEVPSYEMNYLVRANTLQIQMQRSGKLTATIGTIAKGSAPATGTSAAGTPTTVEITRFNQASGQVLKDGVQLGSVTQATISYSNNLDKVETIEPDGEIEDTDTGVAAATGNATVRFKDLVMKNAATGKTPIQLSQRWIVPDTNFSLTFTENRVFLPRTKTPVTGPGGIQASYDWQAAKPSGGHKVTVILVNDVASY